MKTLKRIILSATLVLAALSARADNMSGRIACGGVGIAGVAVSDGYVVTTTDSDGRYSFQSNKRNGYVFYSVPRGYEPAVANNFYPYFWQKIRSTDIAVAEEHDFILTKADNDHHIMLFGADAHLAKRTNDRAQYQAGFIQSLKKEKATADSKGVKIYQTILGDLAWDGYWYKNNYNLQNFLNDNISYGNPIIMYPVIGNHDNDPAVAYDSATPENTNFKSSEPWRTLIAPNYYSYNIGQVHYVVLDDVFYKNQDTGGTYNTGVVGSRNYADRVESYELEWLKKDLALVDKNTPIIVMVHIPVFRLNSLFTAYGTLDNYKDLADVLKDYATVHIMSGHTHYNLNANPSAYPTIHEHNIASICATWWWTGNDNGINIKYQVCQDGSPAGYSYWDIDGTNIKYEYHCIAGNMREQMRLYDMNSVKTFMTTNTNAINARVKYPDLVPTYSNVLANTVMANVYAYNDGWKVEFYENGIKLYSTRGYEYDPYHVLAYDIARFKASGSMNEDFATEKHGHMFKAIATTANAPVTVKVTDNFGNVWVRIINRPATFDLNFADNQKQFLLGDVNGDGEINAADISALTKIILANGTDAEADINFDGDINAADISALTNIILAK